MPNRNPYNRVPAGVDLPSVVNSIVEIPKGRRSKFEVDKKTGIMRLDRYLYSSSHYPGATASFRRRWPRMATRSTCW